MLDMKQILLFLIIINCHMIQGVLEWTVTGKVTDFGQNVTLFCHVPNCCPEDAGWDRWTPVQQTLFIDVKTGHNNKKYDGKAKKDGYTLVIQNLTKEDLNVSYSCLYDVTLGTRKFLFEEDVFTDKSDTTQTDNSGFSEIQIVGIILGIAVTVAVAVAVVVFVIFNWEKRNKRPTNEEGISLIEIGKNKHVPGYIKKPDDPTTSPAQGSLKHGTVSFSMTGKSSEVPKLKRSIQDIKTSYKSEKKKAHPNEDTTQSVIKDQEHHEHHDLTGYYDELLDNTVLDEMVLDNLISRCIIMIEDREEIINPTTQRERNKVLLDILTERPYPTFHLLKDVLLESDPNNSCVQELVKRMMSTESRDEHISWQGHEIACYQMKGKCSIRITEVHATVYMYM